MPTVEHLVNIKILCERVLEPIRAKFGPINISSGYRSSDLNHFIGGSLNSDHCKGRAADIDMDNHGGGVTNRMIFDYIKDNLDVDQLINEFNYSWIHVGYRGKDNRNQVLDAVKQGGKTVYRIHQ